jgi:hypothetical protein
VNRSAAELDLDLRLDQEPNSQWLVDSAAADESLQGPEGMRTNKFPHLRLTGA